MLFATKNGSEQSCLPRDGLCAIGVTLFRAKTAVNTSIRSRARAAELVVIECGVPRRSFLVCGLWMLAVV